MNFANGQTLPRKDGSILCTTAAVLCLFIGLLAATAVPVHAEPTRTVGGDAQAAHHQAELKHIQQDKSGYVAEVVARWENSARDSGRFDDNFASELYIALMKLQPENLASAGEATSYEDLKMVLAAGSRHKVQTAAAKSGASLEIDAAVSPDAIGDTFDDLVYTPVSQCRIVDTRKAGGIVVANTNRGFDVDGTSFAAQGGVASSCGIPFGVARAVAMSIHSLTSTGTGYIYAWSLGGAQPAGPILNFAQNQSVSTGAIIPVDPGSGADFWVRSSVNANIAIDVLGYFAAPVATALDCTSVASAFTAVPANVWTPVDATCPAGYTATGGGFDTNEGTLGFPGVWITSVPTPNNGWRAWVDNQTGSPRNVLAWARCCRVPGR